MDLTTLLLEVREQNIPKDKLEELYTEFLNLFSQNELRLAELEKQEAIFMDARSDESVAAGRRAWEAKIEGQEMIERKRHSRVLEKQLSAVKHRIYSAY